MLGSDITSSRLPIESYGQRHIVNKLQLERLFVGEVQYAILNDTVKPAKMVEVGLI
jgi:hypothetical protein